MNPNEFDPNSPEFIEYKKKLSDHNWEGHVASNKRFDYLLVTVCGAGIYLVLEALKYMNDNELVRNFRVQRHTPVTKVFKQE